MCYNRLMTRYNWQQTDWPVFRYDLTELRPILLKINEKSGYIRGQLTHLSQSMQMETLVSMLVEEAMKTSEIEGEYINRLDVRSSIKNKLGLNPTLAPVKDKRASGVVDMLFDMRANVALPLTDTMLFDWHLMLLSSSRNPNLQVGRWRTDEDPMQVVSGHAGRWKVHFEAPPAEAVPAEMEAFIAWFNETAPGQPLAILDAPVRAAIAHLYFESIHPFDDGNGRIGRVIAEKAISQGVGYPVMLSLSQAIEANKAAYYQALKSASRSNEVTAWIRYFVDVIFEAQSAVDQQIQFILKKTKFFDQYKAQLNPRELKVIERLFKAGVSGFEGGLSAKKYMVIADTSKSTATRDLQNLVGMGILTESGAGPSVRYQLACLSLDTTK